MCASVTDGGPIFEHPELKDTRPKMHHGLEGNRALKVGMGQTAIQHNAASNHIKVKVLMDRGAGTVGDIIPP